MLKRLLSRDKTASQDAKAPSASEPVTTVLVRDGPQSAATSAPQKTTPAPRKAKSLRDSDIKDEFGRSAEEIAAEAAAEFDIEAVVRKAAQMPEPVAKPAVAAPSAPVADAAPAAPVAASAPSPTPTPAPTPAPAPASKAEPKTAPRVRIEAGHIHLAGPSGDAIAKTRAARAAYWDAIGTSDRDLMGYKVSPQLLGQPAWPTHHQNFRLVRTESSLIIASEGLSDPFGAFDTRGTQNGFGVEVFLEICGWQDMPADEVRASWAFKAVEHVARVFAFGQDLSHVLQDNDVLSIDLPSYCVPQGWVVPGVAEPAGALLNIGQPRGRSVIADMPLGSVRAVPLTPIHPEELESCLIEGPSERRALTTDLLTTGPGHRMMTNRTSLR